MVTHQHSAKSKGSIVQEALRAVVSGNPALLEALKFLFSGAAETLSFQRLRLQPPVAAHRNPFSAEPFLLPRNDSEVPRMLRWFLWSATLSMRRFAPTLLRAHIFWSMWGKRQSLLTEAWA